MRWYLALSGALIATYVGGVIVGAPVAVGTTLTQVALVIGLVTVIVGARRYRAGSGWTWLLVTVMLLAVVAEFFPPGVLSGTSSPPSVADAFYLASYLVAAVSLVLIVNRRTPSWSVPALLDGGIITVAAGLLAWVHLIDPILSQPGVDLTTRLVAAAYPLADLLFVALGARMLLDGGPKSPAVLILCGYLLLTVVPDTLNTLDVLAGESRYTTLITGIWLVNCLQLGLLGMHPSMHDVDARSGVATPDLSPLRLVALTFATLLAPATLLVQHLRGAPLHVPLIAGSCIVLFLLVTGRLAGLVAIQRRMAVTDTLTGLHSRRFADDALSALSRRPGTSAAVLLLDIDHFKRINDTYGHDAGDRVLREVAHRLMGAVRKGDLTARYGGEEFLVLLPAASPDDAAAVAARVHEAIRRVPVAVSGDAVVTMTVSVGLACLPSDVPTPDRLTAVADQMLYRAKQLGRDRVVAARVHQVVAVG